MRSRIVTRYVPAFLLLLSALALSDVAGAASKTVSVSALRTLIAGLGLKDVGDKKGYAQIDNQGSQGLSIFLRPVDDGKYLQIYTALGMIPEDKLAYIPSKKMLQYNDENQFYFTMTEKNGLFLQARINAVAVTPQVIREQIDALESAVDETEALWDPEQWEGTQRSGCLAPGSSLPLVAAATMVTDTNNAANDIHKRPDLNYKIDEPFIFYIQPFNFACQKEGESYKADFSVDVQMLHDNRVVLDQPGAIKQKFSSAVDIKSVGFDLTNTVTGLVPGVFTFAIKINDLIGGRSASTKVDVTVVK